MLKPTFSGAPPAIRFEYANWVASDPLPRDRTQSQLLHEPKYRIDTIDPITGKSIDDITGHPSLVDGNLTIYFETQAVIPPFLADARSGDQATRANFCLGVMPPRAMFGRSWL